MLRIIGVLVAFFVFPVIVAAGNFPDFIVLPDYVATPDGMAICPTTGELVVACPNFGNDSKPACLIRINSEGVVRKWLDIPVLPETGKAYPMGIDFAPDGSLFVCDNQNWLTGNGDNGEINRGRLLRLVIQGDEIVETIVVAENLSHPNGVKVRDGFAWVTISLLPQIKAENGLLYSGVFRFLLDTIGVTPAQSLSDPYLYVAFQTHNKDCQYGADGLCFNREGDLIIGNFGDGTLLRAVLGDTGKVVTEVYAACSPIPPLNDCNGNPDNDFLAKATAVAMRTVDGICCDPKSGDIYIADFSNNAIARMAGNDRSVSFVAQSGDSNGQNGELNQPGEPGLWNGRIAVTCFDMVSGPDKVNTKHDAVATIVFLPH